MRFLLGGLIASAIIGCGSRTDLNLSKAQGGYGGSVTFSGAGGDAGASGGAGGGAGGPACVGLSLLDPVVPLGVAAEVRAPEISVAPDGGGFITYIEAPTGVAGPLKIARLDAFETWPPSAPAEPKDLTLGVEDYVAGPGPGGPVALIQRPLDTTMATQLLPTLEETFFAGQTDETLFAVGIEGRTLAAGITTTPYDYLVVGSYQPGGLPQSEPPLVCSSSRVLAAAIPAGSGFLAAFTEPNPPGGACPSPSLPIISLMRYESGAQPGASLMITEGDKLVSDDTVMHVALAPAPFGAWRVHQLAGDNARSPPPIMATRFDPSGVSLSPGSGDPGVAVSPDGYTSPRVAVAAFGDHLAVAWVDAIDPSSPTIVIQLVTSGATLGPSASIPTSVVWQTGRIRLLSSPDAQSLLVAWEGGVGEAQIGLARLDCEA